MPVYTHLLHQKEIAMKKVEETMDEFIMKCKSDDLASVSETVCCWDFNNALGCTVSDKYESLRIKILEVSYVLIKNGAKGYFWVLCSPEIAAILDVTSKFEHERDLPVSNYYPMGFSEKKCIGILDKRWRVYADPDMKDLRIVVGCGSEADPKIMARISIANFII